MKNEDIILEVKTMWLKKNDGYVRQVINYNCIPNEELDNVSYAVRFIKEINNYQEFTNTIINNNYEICVKNAKTNKETDYRNDFINTILEYTKQQWNIEE